MSDSAGGARLSGRAHRHRRAHRQELKASAEREIRGARSGERARPGRRSRRPAATNFRGAFARAKALRQRNTAAFLSRGQALAPSRVTGSPSWRDAATSARDGRAPRIQAALPPQAVDQFVQLIRDRLHFGLRGWVAHHHAQRRHSVSIRGSARDRRVHIGLRRARLRIRIQRRELPTHLRARERGVIFGFGRIKWHGLEIWRFGDLEKGRCAD